jgi:magnesium/cobalt transport protein CorA
MGFAVVFDTADKTCSIQDSSVPEAFAAREGAFTWLDFEAGEEAALKETLQRMGVSEKDIAHVAAMSEEPLVSLHQNLIVNYIHLAKEERGKMVETPLLMAMNDRIIVTAHSDPLPQIGDVQGKCDESFRSVGKSPGFVFFLLWDAIIDHFMPHISTIDNRLEQIEDRYLRGDTSDGILQEIVKCKQAVRALKQCLAPMQRGMRRLVTMKLALISDEAHRYLNGIFEHMDRVGHQIDSLQDRLKATLDGYSSTLSQRMNSSMKILTIIATIMMPLSLVAGIYGTNFEHIPELSWKYGYFAFLGFLAVVAGLMLYLFKRRKWL